MAQGHQDQPQAATLWAEAAARCGYSVHNGSPLIGVSGDEGDGFIVPLPAPSYMTHITDEGTRDNVFRALAAHALRVGQAKLKAADKPTREVATEGVASAVNGGYKPGRERTNDIVETEARKRFDMHVRNRVLAVKADATEAQIVSTIAAQADTDGGKKLLAKLTADILSDGVYTVSRKGKGAGAVSIGEL